jgi:type I restriction enzyme R subunit
VHHHHPAPLFHAVGRAREAAGLRFTAQQRWWLDHIAAHIGVNLGMTADDFDCGELFQRGGWIAARRLFGSELPALLEELNETLVV